jgi:hypothetical protein
MTGTGAQDDDGGDVGSPPSPWWRRWWWVWTAAAAVLVAAGVGIWAVLDDDNGEDAAPSTTSTSVATVPTTTTSTPTSTTTRTTSEPTVLTTTTVAAWMNEDAQSNNIQVEIVCADTGPIAVGGVLACHTRSPNEPVEVEEAGVIVYVLDTTGRAAYDIATDIPESTENLMARYAAAPKGLYCRDLLNEDIDAYPFRQGGTPDADAYLWSLVYWSLEGEPDRMDADLNGVPCETLYAPDVVAQVLDGGFLGG